MKAKSMRRNYQCEAAIMLAVARLAVEVVPPSRLFAWASRPPRRVQRFPGDEAGWVGWAVETVGAKPWMRALCLPRAIAAQTMLRRRGIASKLCLGVARNGGAMEAHAWVEIGSDKIVGGIEAQRFTRLAEFGGASR
jgi:Transglutaminase-like superfamily